jgi:hypothetical protein
MRSQILKEFMKTGVVEASLITAALLFYGSCQGVIHANPDARSHASESSLVEGGIIPLGDAQGPRLATN